MEWSGKRLPELLAIGLGRNKPERIQHKGVMGYIGIEHLLRAGCARPGRRTLVRVFGTQLKQLVQSHSNAHTGSTRW